MGPLERRRIPSLALPLRTPVEAFSQGRGRLLSSGAGRSAGNYADVAPVQDVPVGVRHVHSDADCGARVCDVPGAGGGTGPARAAGTPVLPVQDAGPPGPAQSPGESQSDLLASAREFLRRHSVLREGMSVVGQLEVPTGLSSTVHGVYRLVRRARHVREG